MNAIQIKSEKIEVNENETSNELRKKFKSSSQLLQTNQLNHQQQSSSLNANTISQQQKGVSPLNIQIDRLRRQLQMAQLDLELKNKIIQDFQNKNDSTAQQNQLVNVLIKCQSTNKELEEQVCVLKTEINNRDQAIHSLIERNNQLNSNISSLNQRIKELNDSLKTRDAQLLQNDPLIKRLQHDLVFYQTQQKQLNMHINQINYKLEEKENEIRGKNFEIDNLKSILKDSSRKIINEKLSIEDDSIVLLKNSTIDGQIDKLKALLSYLFGSNWSNISYTKLKKENLSEIVDIEYQILSFINLLNQNDMTFYKAFEKIIQNMELNMKIKFKNFNDKKANNLKS